MSRLRSSSLRDLVWRRSSCRLLGIAALCLALFAGTGVVTAGNPSPPPAKENDASADKPDSKSARSRSSRSKPRPASRSRRKSPRKTSKRGKTPKPKPDQPKEEAVADEQVAEEAAKSTDLAKELDIDFDAEYEQMLKPAEERSYSISIEQGTYGDLLDAFSHMSGLAILGDTPSGQVTYVSTEQLDYPAALSRIREILFSHPENFYIWREGNSLEVFRVTEAQRKMKPDRIYTSVEMFQDAGLDEMEIVLVLYTPKEGRVADLEQLRDFMPDYVRIAPYRDKNALTILALARDVRKYLDLVNIFQGAADDPRPFEGIPIEHVLPSHAVSMLHQFMPDLRGGAAAAKPARSGKGRKKRPPAPSLARVKGHGIELIPYDDVKTLFVRAMPDKIAEVKKYLLIIDVDLAVGLGDMIIITPEHVRVEQLMNALRPMYGGKSSAAAPKKSARGKGKSRSKRTPRRSTPAAGSIITDTIRIYPNSTNNTLIVMAKEEELTKLRMYMSLYDIPSQSQTARVAVEHADPETIQPVAEQIAQSVDAILAGLVMITRDPVNNEFILVGDSQAIELYRGIIEDLDQPGEETDIHIYECRYISPSILINLLNTLDKKGGGGSAARAPAKSRQAKRGKASPKPRRPSRGKAAGGTKYHGDDATGKLYVVCTDEEWEQDYLPLIEMLDREAKVNTDIEVIPVENLEAAEIITQINQAMVTPVGVEKPTMLPHSTGIMVPGATESELEQIRSLVELFDVDPEIERRTFTLRYADPAEVKSLLESLVVGKKTARPKPTRRGKRADKRKGKRPSAAPAVVSTAGEIKIIEKGRNELIVVAPRAEMEEIAELIEEFDVDPLNIIVKVYTFPPNANVKEIATTLSSFYPGSSSVPIGAPQPKSASKSKGRRRSKAGKPRSGGLQKTKAGDIRFIPHISAHKIIVSAPEEMIPDIEEKIAILQPEEPAPGPAIEFVRLENIDPQKMANIIEPILEIKYAELVETGVIRETLDAKGTSEKTISVMPDPRGDRLIVIVPPALMEDAKTLIAELDRPDRERIVRTVMLERANPKEMVTAIKAMLANRPNAAMKSTKSSPRRSGKRGKGGKARPAPAKPVATKNVTIVAAPGGSALVLEGYEEDVDQVEQWIKDLDEASKGGREIKIYNPQNIDVEKFADVVMTLVDSGGGRKPSKPKRRGKGQEVIETFDIGGGPRRGKDIYLVSDVWASTMVVSASPAKIREIDNLYEMYEGKPGEEPLIQTGNVQPFDTYPLEHREDAYEAVYDLEMILDALWPDPENVPKIDYIPFTEIMTIRGRPDDFAEVRKLIKKYVDKPGKEGEETRDFKVIKPEKMTARELAAILQERIGADRVVIQGLPKPGEKDYLDLIDQVQPCVLPLSALRWMSLAATGLDDEPQDEDEPEPESPNAPGFDKDVEGKLAILRSITGDAEPAETEAQDDADTNGTEAEKEQPLIPESFASAQKLTIVVDDERGLVYLRGATREVADANYLIDKIKKEMEEIDQPPDIRVFRLKYIDVNAATTILESMFNAPRQRRLTPQQRRALQQQQKKQKQAQAQQDKNKRRPGQPQPAPQIQQQQPGQIRVFPDARTHTIVVRAAPEQYPVIIKLLATIDKKGTAADFRIYKLERLNAAEVEETLKEILGLNARTRQAARRQPQRRTPQRPGQKTPQNLPTQQQFEFAGLGGESLSLGAADRITISSNPATNTIMVVAPEKTLDMIGQLIEQLEERTPPERITETYVVQHADATEIVTQLEQLFGAGRSSSRGGRGGKSGKAGKSTGSTGFDPTEVNNPIFVPLARTNSIVIRALEPDMPKILAMIERLDQKSDGDAPTYIKLEHVKPSEIAKKLQEAFGGKKSSGGRRGSKGGGTSPTGVTITADDGSKQLIVTAPAKALANIREMISRIDVEQTNLDFKVYPLTHATAADVLQRMNQLLKVLKQTGKKQGVDLGAFSAVADEASNSLVVAGEPSVFSIVEGILAKLDVPPSETVLVETRTYHLESARASDVANTINRLYGKKRGKGGPAPAQAEANQSTNILLVRGNKKQQEEIYEKVIKPLEELGDQTARVTETYTLKNASPDTLVQIIGKQFSSRGKGAEGDRVDAAVDAASRTVVVTASPANQEKVAALIAKLDNAAAVGGPVKELYQVKHARAGELVTTLKEMLGRGGGRGKTQITVVANEPLNQVILSGTQKDVNEALTLLESLDKKPLDSVGRVVEVYDLKYADPDSMSRTIEASFAKGGRGKSSQDTVKASYVRGTNSLAVSASRENHEKIKELIARMDVESSTQRTTHVVKLEKANAEDLAERLGQVYQKMRGSKRGEGSMSITADPGTNSLLIYANETEFAQVQELVATLDVTPEERRQIRSFQLKHARVENLQEAVAQLFGGSRGSRGGRGGRGSRGGSLGGDQVSVYADEASNTLVVATSAEHMARIEAFINDVDKPGMGDRSVTVVEIENADASAVADALQDMFAGSSGRGGRRGGGGGQQGLSISNMPGSNSLIIRANEKELAEIQAVIAELETTGTGGGGEIRIVPLKYSDAEETKAILEEYLRKPGTRGSGGRSRGRGRSGSSGAGELIGGVRISVSAQNNSLVLSGEAEQLEKVCEVIAQLDVESSMQRTTHVVKLEKADAEDLAERLGQVYQQTRGGRGSRGSRSEGGSMSITADPGTNSLLIYANETEFTKLQRLLATLDVTPEERRQIRSFHLNHADAENLQESVTQLFGGSRGGRSGRGGRGGGGGSALRGQVDVYADGASNTLVVAASPEDMARVEAFLAEVDKPGMGDRQVTVVKIENADASSVASALQDMFTGSSGRRGRGGGGGAQQGISISNPQGSDAVIIRANETELAEIQAVIDELEAAGTGAGGAIKIVSLKFSDAEETKAILEEYLRKPGTRGGGGGRGRRSSSAGTGADLIGGVRISVSAKNNALILSGDKEQLEEVCEVIAQLDVEMDDSRLPKIIKLQHARATDIQPQLEELFKQQRKGRDSGSTEPVIVADEAANSLIVRAGAAEMNAIMRLVGQLDAADAAPEEIRIVQVASGINVEDMAAMLEESFNASAKSTGGRKGGAKAQQLIVTPDKRTNSLMLAGAPALFDKAEAVIRKYEEMGPKGGQVIKVIRLDERDVGEIEPIIRGLIEDTQGSSKKKSPSRSRGSGKRGRK